jgi:hypothetical protein
VQDECKCLHHLAIDDEFGTLHLDARREWRKFGSNDFLKRRAFPIGPHQKLVRGTDRVQALDEDIAGIRH